LIRSKQKGNNMEKNIKEDKSVKKLIISIAGSRITTNFLLCFLIYGLTFVVDYFGAIYQLLILNT
tara:strand:- start:47 stop:241 length:195 start_codon:yes stop_codon:yes gene_type:complete